MEVYIGPVYTSYNNSDHKTQRIFNVFCEDIMILQIFMSKFVGRFCYNTYFPHYTVYEHRRAELIEAGAVPVDEETERKHIHEWQNKALQNRFLEDEP